MPSNFMGLDDFPTFTGQESPKEQIRALHNYLFVMREYLGYTLQNLSAENWNETALQKLTEGTQSELVKKLQTVSEQLSKLSQKVEALTQVVQKSDTGTTIGEEGKELRLVGTVYINGVLLAQEGGST